MPELQGNIMFVLALMLVGLWLEHTGGKNGFWDSFFTPFPLGGLGVTAIVILGAVRAE
jgi:hypothetical protein